jgi:hypothetical protein
MGHGADGASNVVRHVSDDLYLALTRYRVLGSPTSEMASRQTLTVTDVQMAIDYPAGVKATVSEAKWVSLYRLHQRMAQQFRASRGFLVGDPL